MNSINNVQQRGTFFFFPTEWKLISKGRSPVDADIAHRPAVAALIICLPGLADQKLLPYLSNIYQKKEKKLCLKRF